MVRGRLRSSVPPLEPADEPTAPAPLNADAEPEPVSWDQHLDLDDLSSYLDWRYERYGRGQSVD